MFKREKWERICCNGLDSTRDKSLISLNSRFKKAPEFKYIKDFSLDHYSSGKNK